MKDRMCISEDTFNGLPKLESASFIILKAMLMSFGSLLSVSAEIHLERNPKPIFNAVVRKNVEIERFIKLARPFLLFLCCSIEVNNRMSSHSSNSSTFSHCDCTPSSCWVIMYRFCIFIILNCQFRNVSNESCSYPSF